MALDSLDGEYLIEATATCEQPYEVKSTTSKADNFTAGSTVTGIAYPHSVEGYGISRCPHPLPLLVTLR